MNEVKMHCAELCRRDIPWPHRFAHHMAVLLRYDGMTLEQIGKHVGLSRERTRQILLREERPRLRGSGYRRSRLPVE